MRRQNPKRDTLPFSGRKGKKRCRMHGGAAGSGAPKGNKNALKHGLYTAESKEMRRVVQALERRTLEIIDE